MTAANALSLGLQAFVDYHVEAIIEEQLLSVLELIVGMIPQEICSDDSGRRLWRDRRRAD